MTIQTFKDLIVWQKAHQLVLLAYALSEKYPKSELFALTSQTRRCAASIASNIAEGFKRKSKKDSLHFYNMAEASLEELKYDLILSKDLSYINTDEFSRAMNQSEEVGRLFHGWMNSQK